MFLLERLIGVTAFVFFLAAVCLLLAFSALKVKTILRFYVLVLAALAFWYQPYVTADLYRIRRMMTLYSAYSFSSFFRYFVVFSSTPAARILYWMVGKTGIYGLLPALTAAICYSCFFHIIEKCGELNRISRGNLALTLLFFMSAGQYMSVISNIRTMLAAAIVFYCFFREAVEKKFSWFHIILYAAALYIHNLAAIFMGLRLLAPALNRGRPPQRRLWYFVILAAGAAAVILLDSAFMEAIARKGKAYLSGGYSYAWEYVIGGLILAAAAYTLALRRRQIGRKISDFDICLRLCCGAALVSAPVFSVFYRFAAGAVPILMIPSLTLGLENDNKIPPGRGWGKKLSAQSVVFILAFVVLLLSCTRGDLCSYKFFTLSGKDGTPCCFL